MDPPPANADDAIEAKLRHTQALIAVRVGHEETTGAGCRRRTRAVTRLGRRSALLRTDWREGTAAGASFASTRHPQLLHTPRRRAPSSNGVERQREPAKPVEVCGDGKWGYAIIYRRRRRRRRD
ncbi:hypothetical protein C8R46DRAFT_1026565 [Mycena filopes]|nr:hypothetical protein C8R46DRAFT_1026565 [Mycena filopes]